mgnify:FL=1
MKKPPKKQTISKLKKEVWKIFSLYIRLKYSDWRGYVSCYTCGTIKFYKQIHAGHFISRQFSATIFDKNNVRPQCYACNIIKKGSAGRYAQNLINELGDQKFKELLKKGNTLKQFSIKELEELKIEISLALDKLPNKNIIN